MKLSFKNVFDADFSEIGETLGTIDNNFSIEENGKRALYNAKPIPLTGRIEVDAKMLCDFIRTAFAQYGVNVGDAVVDSPNFGNEIRIEILQDDAETGYTFETMLDYTELAYNGSDFNLQLNFTEPEGDCLDFIELNDELEILRLAKTIVKTIKMETGV
jgi:hypothetical protein